MLLCILVIGYILCLGYAHWWFLVHCMEYATADGKTPFIIFHHALTLVFKSKIVNGMKSTSMQWNRIWCLLFFERCSVYLLYTRGWEYSYVALFCFYLAFSTDVILLQDSFLFHHAPDLRHFQREDMNSKIPPKSKFSFDSWIRLVAIFLLYRICGVAWSSWR